MLHKNGPYPKSITFLFYVLEKSTIWEPAALCQQFTPKARSDRAFHLKAALWQKASSSLEKPPEATSPTYFKTDDGVRSVGSTYHLLQPDPDHCLLRHLFHGGPWNHQPRKVAVNPNIKRSKSSTWSHQSPKIPWLLTPDPKCLLFYLWLPQFAHLSDPFCIRGWIPLGQMSAPDLRPSHTDPLDSVGWHHSYLPFPWQPYPCYMSSAYRHDWLDCPPTCCDQVRCSVQYSNHPPAFLLVLPRQHTVAPHSLDSNKGDEDSRQESDHGLEISSDPLPDEHIGDPAPISPVKIYAYNAEQMTRKQILPP